MGLKEEKINPFFSNLTIRKKSKGNLSNEKPVFFDKGSSLIVSSGKSCHLYNTSTGNHVKELFQCTDDIISYQLHPLDPSLMIAITENGEVTVFNLKNSEVEHTCNLTLNKKFMKKHNPPKFNSEDEEGDEEIDWDLQPLDSLLHRKFVYAEVRAFQNNPNCIFIWATWSLNDEKKSHLSVFTFNKGKHIGLLHLRRTGLKKCYLNFTVGTVQGKDILAGMSASFVHIAHFDIKKTNFYKKHTIGTEAQLTCLALHPVECCFATGDSTGRIIIWRNIFENHPLKDVFHWHPLPVHDLCFSSFGNCLYSGGEENVLVKWSLSTRTKDFLPRLSSNILHISGTSEANFLSISTMDNKILIIDSNFQKISTIQHFSTWSAIKGENKFNIFTFDPRSNCLVLSGKTGHIQFLSLNEDGKFIYTFDVTNRNLVVSVTFAPIQHTQVTHARFNVNGNWLVTVESRLDESVKECRIKFWLYGEKNNSFKLNTNVELPHEEFEVHSLEISLNDLVATSGGDKKFRLWSNFTIQKRNWIKTIWSVQHINCYRNLPCYAIDFSKDSSLVAVTFGHVLTIWDTELCSLKCSLSAPYKKDRLTFCKFGNNELSHLVVTGTEFGVSTWNTITLSMIWTVPFKLSLLISDPFSIYMVAFSIDSNMIIFNPASPSPDLIFKKICDFPVIAAHCLPDETGNFCLYFLTSNQELYSLEDEGKVSVGVSGYTPKTFLTPYSSQIAEIQNRTEKERNQIQVNKNNDQLVSNLLDSPAHTLPNPSLLCSDILKRLLVFSRNQSSVLSVKDSRNDDTEEYEKSQSEPKCIDSDQLEVQLLNIVQTIFV